MRWTPWGWTNDFRELAPGITWFSTPSHGGFFVTAARRQQLPPHTLFQNPPGNGVDPKAGAWYEEDVDAALVFAAFPELKEARMRTTGMRSKVWEIWLCAPHTGDKRELLYSYSNRGHALAKLRGLRRKAWRATSEAEFHLVRG